MKRTMQLIAITLIVALGLYAGRHYNSAEEAAINCHEVQTCLAEGYVMESCVAQPIYYLIPPTGAYNWGTVQVELRCDPSLGKPQVSATCFIEARNMHGSMNFRETHNTVLVPIR